MADKLRMLGYRPVGKVHGKKAFVRGGIRVLVLGKVNVQYQIKADYGWVNIGRPERLGV